MTARTVSRPPAWVVLMATGLAAANALAFMLIAEDLWDGGGLISHDEAVLQWFVEVRTGALITAANIVSTLGGFVGLLILSILVAVVVHQRGWPWFLSGAPLVALFAAFGLSTVAKSLFGRPRPPETVHATHVTLAAFPSSHAADAAACLLTVSLVVAFTLTFHRLLRVLVIVAGLGLAGLIGVSRLVLGVHWLSDVAAGWALGNAIALVVLGTAWWVSAPPKRAGRSPVAADGCSPLESTEGDAGAGTESPVTPR